MSEHFKNRSLLFTLVGILPTQFVKISFFFCVRVCSEGKVDSTFFKIIFDFFWHVCYCLVSFVPMLILHSIALACYFFKMYLHSF